MSVAGSTGTITAVTHGTANVTVTATDPGGLSVEQAVGVTVPNRAPVATDSIPALTVRVGESVDVDFAGHFSDPDGDELTYSAVSSDAGVVRVSVAGATGTITAVTLGTANVAVTATDPGGLSVEQAVRVTVSNRANRPPEAADFIGTQTVYVGESIELHLAGRFRDPDGDELTYTAVSSDADVARVSVAGLQASLTGVALGNARVTVTATDPGGLSAEQAFGVAVRNRSNRAPVVADSIGSLSLLPGDTVTLDLNTHFSDPDGDPLSFRGVTTDPRVARLRLIGSNARIIGVAPFAADIHFLAIDPGDLIARIVVRVTVQGEGSGDRAVLIKIYESTGGPNWHRQENWLTDAPLSSWQGVVTTDDDATAVRTLSLRGNNLTGSIPPEIGQLSSLDWLMLDANNLTGSIPAEIGNLPLLRDLFLAYNNLTGTIPPEIGNLDSLRVLNLNSNNLSGSIPPEIGRLARVRYLKMDNNNLTDSIPPELGGLSSVRYLTLGSNRLTGSLPSEIGRLSQLEWLQLHDNRLTGAFPASFTSLGSLFEVTWNDNDGLCVPRTSAFDTWLARIRTSNGPRCGDSSTVREPDEVVGSFSLPVVGVFRERVPIYRLGAAGAPSPGFAVSAGRAGRLWTTSSPKPPRQGLTRR